jgi:hypothetical protein
MGAQVNAAAKAAAHSRSNTSAETSLEQVTFPPRRRSTTNMAKESLERAQKSMARLRRAGLKRLQRTLDDFEGLSAGEIKKFGGDTGVRELLKNFNLRLRLLQIEEHGKLRKLNDDESKPAVQMVELTDHHLKLSTIEREPRELLFKEWPKFAIFEAGTGRGSNITSEVAARAGHARTAQLTQKQRVASAKKAAAARWQEK